jgi:Apea-like HEPN
MTRLASAWSGWRREERTIDLGICLETLLTYTPRGRADDNNEIGYKLGVRAGWLMGANLKDRLTAFKKVRRLYPFRSQAAHCGEVKTKPETWRALDEEIEAGIGLAGEVVVALLARGAWPDWDELVLGGSADGSGDASEAGPS